MPDIFSDERCQMILKVLSHLSYEMMAQRKVLFRGKDINALGLSITDIPTEASGFIVKKSDVLRNVYQFKRLVLQEFLSACYLVTKSEALTEEILPKGHFINVIPLVAGLQGMMIDSQSSELIESFTKLLNYSTEPVKLPATSLVISSIFNRTHNLHYLIASVFEFAKDMPETCRIEIVRQLNRSNFQLSIIHYHELNYFLHFMNQILLRNDTAVESGHGRNESKISLGI